MDYTVYALVDPETDMIRYVGVTSQKYLSDRFDRHLKDADCKSVKGRWLWKLRSLSLRPKIIKLEYLEDVTKEYAYQCEWDYVTFYNAFLPLPLTNYHKQNGTAGDSSALVSWMRSKRSPVVVPVELIGTMSDAKLAKMCGCSKREVLRRRHALGIPSWQESYARVNN